MANCESGVRFLNRIHNKKHPVTVLNQWFPEETAFNQQTVEIIGLPSTGKTFLLLDLISDVILPLEANGLNSVAILISNDQNFDIVKLMEICCSKKKSIDIDDVVKRLLIIENYDEFQLKLSFQRVENLISSLKNVALVAVDNLLAFYWQNRENKSFQKAEVYSKMLLEKLRESCLLSSAIMVYTRPQFNTNDGENDNIPEIRPKITNKRIILRRNGSQFEAECQSAAGVSSIKDGATEKTQPIAQIRKRDKVIFYGRKMIRKMLTFSKHVQSNSGSGRKRKTVMKFVRKLLQLKKDAIPLQLQVLEPPAEYLEESLNVDERLPPDALYLLQSIRVFGHFNRPIFLKLCKHIDILNVAAGSYLFKVGDLDENIFVVQSGLLNVTISNNPDGSILSLKTVNKGESIFSLLSFTDVLTGHTSKYKTVSAKAVEDSVVVRLPMKAFIQLFNEYPDIIIRIIQVIMVRLQRVTFTALHQYLGLSAELVNPSSSLQRRRSTHRSSSPSKYPANPNNHTDSQNPAIIIDDHATDRNSELGSDKNRMAGDPDPDSELKIPSRNESNAKPTEQLSSMDEEALITIAKRGFKFQLGLNDDHCLNGKIKIKEIQGGTYVIKEDSHKDVALVYIISGTLIVSQKTTDIKEEVHMFTAHQGELVGGLAVLTGEPSFFTIRAKHTSRLALISRNTFYSIVCDHPKVVLHVAHTVITRLSPFVRQVDFALDWLFMESGRAVYRQGDESDSTFIVLSGRLRSVIKHENSKKELVAEYGKGDLVGIVETVTQTVRGTTVMAIRDSELAKLPEGLFNVIKFRFPIVVTRLINLLGHRILGTWQKTPVSANNKTALDTRPSQLNFSTIAIVAVTDDVPIAAFTYELYFCLSLIGSTVRLTSELVRRTFGAAIMDPNNEYRFTLWLAQQEDQHRITLYQCDYNYSTWTQRCIRQADCILIVGHGDSEPAIGKIEREIERLAIRTQKELILLYKDANAKPVNTVAWLNMRSWVSSHHHILYSKRMYLCNSPESVSNVYSKFPVIKPNIHSDFSRLSRWLTGTSVGLVLGGGGARGSAHVGMIKAIQEANIPIDMVGGVSIGAFMGALWCMERNITTLTQKARSWSSKMTQWWRQIFDITYPYSAWLTGSAFNKTIMDTFGDTLIEDLWIPYFTVTTDITSSCRRIHTYGSLWRYVRSSMSLSGYMPPLCDPVDGHYLLDGGYVNNLPGSLWKYVRSSMSIAGVMPPLCDPIDGHHLLDGCYVNNVPADIMRSFGANHIIAIDVGSVDDAALTNYGDNLSGWWVQYKRWNPFTSNVRVLNIADIQSRLAYVSCVRQLEEVKNSDYCEYIRPPIDSYRTLQFGSFDEIREVGYQHGKSYFQKLKESGTFPKFYIHRSSQNFNNFQREPKIAGHSFIDLAKMVCKVSKTNKLENSTSSSEIDDFDDNESFDDDDEYFGNSDDDMEAGYASEPSVGNLSICNVALRRRRKRLGGSLSDQGANSSD